ncbi:MAG TPA: molybdopterin oxidoreductase family protein, partial [Rubrivivax sp.]|nr:molybdopterin oxidoreductase family protein [Rubrivivax sp.]
DHPTTHGALCTKVSRYAERTYHPERVLTPLKHSGPKGSGRFEPVGWDEALDDIAARLRSIAAGGPDAAQAILPYSYAGTMGLVQGDGMAARFFHRLGASLLDRTICSSAGGEALAATYGGKVGMHVEFFAESRLILVWGSNPITSSVHFWTFAQQAKRAGAKLVCIDPRRTDTADKCHQHIALLPGTDGALALALMHELVVNGWLDHDYISRHVEGWPGLRERALQWPPERAAAVCGITVEEVRGLARDYGGTAPAAIRLNYGMQRVRGGGSAVRLIALLPCLVGAWRHRAGGLLLSSSGWFRGARRDAWLQRPDLLVGPDGKLRTPRTINMVTIGDDLNRGASPAFGPRIEAVVVYNSNPVAVAPESARVARGFAREDLFTVVLEHFLTDTADHADYVLPATTQLEHWDAHTAYGHTYALLNEPAIAPLGQARSNAAIFRALAERMGFTEACFADSDEAMARGAFDPERVDLAALREQGWAKLKVADAPFAEGGFPTASGRVVVDAPGLGVPDHVPNYESALSTPELARRYPLAMVSPPARHFLNSSFVNVPSLRAAEREPLLEIHPQDAAVRGIASGAEVRVFNDRGEYFCKAEVSERARPGVVVGLGVWWRKYGLAGTNVNQLTHQRLTDIGRAPTFYDCLVEVESAQGAPEA